MHWAYITIGLLVLGGVAFWLLAQWVGWLIEEAMRED